jgi:hypothetical protein
MEVIGNGYQRNYFYKKISLGFVNSFFENGPFFTLE